MNDTGKMMYVWLTEYMADTAGFVYQQAGQLNYNVTPSMVSSSQMGMVANCHYILQKYIFLGKEMLYYVYCIV